MHAQSAAARWRQQGVSQVSPAQLRSISNSKRSSSRMKTKKKKKAAREGGEKRRELRAQSKQLLEQHLDGTRMEWQPDLCSPVAQAWADMRNTLERNERKQHQQNYYNLCIPFLFLFSVFCLFFSCVCVCESVPWPDHSICGMHSARLSIRIMLGQSTVGRMLEKYRII